MRYRFYFSLLVILTSCSVDPMLTTEQIGPFPVEIETVETSIQGKVYESRSSYSLGLDRLQLSNVTVELLYAGQVIDQTNTDLAGAFSFPVQRVPETGAYLQLRAPGYYPAVYPFRGNFTGSSHFLVPSTLPAVSGAAIADRPAYITLSGTVQAAGSADAVSLFITNAANELLDAYTTEADLSFRFTAVPDEEIFLHYTEACAATTAVSLGSFPADAELGVLFDETFNFSEALVTGNIIATDCAGGSLPSGTFLTNLNGRTVYSGEDLYQAATCDLLADPAAYITYLDPENRRYGEQAINYTTGPAPDVLIEACTTDDTYVHVAIDGGTTNELNQYTYANTTNDGRIIVKQVNFSGIGPEGLALELQSGNPGETTGRLRIIDNTTEIIEQANDFPVTVTLNDGNFIEGTYSTEFFNEFEESLGLLTGTFRARLHL